MEATIHSGRTWGVGFLRNIIPPDWTEPQAFTCWKPGEYNKHRIPRTELSSSLPSFRSFALPITSDVEVGREE